MLSVASLSILSVAFAIVWSAYWVGNRIERLTHSITKATTVMTETPRGHLSKLGDSLDALRESVREVDTKVESALSLGRSNRAKIRNMRFGNEEDAPAPPNGKAATVLSLPGRDS